VVFGEGGARPGGRSERGYFHWGRFAFPSRGTCKGGGAGCSLPIHRFVRPPPAHSRSNSPASRRPRLICVSPSDSRGLQDDPRCRSTYGGTSGLRTIALSTLPPAHVATSASELGGPIHQRLARYSSTQAADALA